MLSALTAYILFIVPKAAGSRVVVSAENLLKSLSAKSYENANFGVLEKKTVDTLRNFGLQRDFINIKI